MKQKLLAILLVLGMVGALIPAFAVTSAAANTSAGTVTDGTLPENAQVLTGTATAFSGGAGTAEAPYQIKDVTEFRYFQQQAQNDATYLSKSYILTGNIYFNGKLDYTDAATGMPNDVKIPSANAYSQITGTFSGTFDGANYGIYNTYARFANAGALFATVTGTIKNLNLYGGYVYFGNSTDSGSLVQLLSGGTISNCYSSVGIYTKASATGGLVGRATGSPTIEDCTYAGAISAPNNGSNQVGGIVARVESALTISRCANYAPISAQYSRIGGMVGFFIFKDSSVTITECVNYGNLTSTSGKTDGGVGGMVGLNYTGSGNNGVVNYLRCANYGDITASSNLNATGMAGEAGNVTSYNSCANYGNVTGKEATAGIHRTAAGSGITITNCYSEGTFTTISTTSSAGLVVGWIKNGATLKNCVGTGSAALYGGSSSVVTLTNNQKFDKGALDMASALAILNADLETPVWVAGANAPELSTFYVAPETPAIAIAGASLTVGDNVTLNLFVNKATVDAANISLQNIYVVSGSNTYLGTLENDKYVFKITGLTAKEFGVNKTYAVKYTTTDGDTVVSTATKDYSPLQYAINMYGKHPEMETLDPLLLAIVNYADVAGGTGAKIDFVTAVFKVADTSVIEMAWSKLPVYDQVLAGDTGSYTYTDYADLPKFGATLSETLTLTATLTGSGYKNLSVKIGGEELATVTGGEVTVSGLYATDLYNTMVLTYTTDADETVSVTWSLMQYLDSFQGGSDAALAEATAIYLYAARAFCIANHN